MSDPFIDALHARLSAAQATHPSGSPDDGADHAAFARWWDEFADVLGQKIGAWNERQAPRSPINFTPCADGTVRIYHPSADATLRRTGRSVHAALRLGHDAVILRFILSEDAQTAVLVGGSEMHSPTEAAEHVITPLLIRAFSSP